MPLRLLDNLASYEMLCYVKTERRRERKVGQGDEAVKFLYI